MSGTVVKTLRYELEIDDDGASQIAQLLAVPFSTTRYRRKLGAVRLLFATGQDHTLGECQVKLFLRNDDHASQGFMLYDSGALVDGEIPDGATEAIDMNPTSTEGLFWDDSLGEHARDFEVNNGQALWIDITGTPASGAGTSTLIFEADCIQQVG